MTKVTFNNIGNRFPLYNRGRVFFSGLVLHGLQTITTIVLSFFTFRGKLTEE